MTGGSGGAERAERAERVEKVERVERARLFVALDLGEDVRAALAQWRAHILRAHPGVRPVPEESLHVTLCFLGWRALGEVDAIAAACAVRTGAPLTGLRLGSALWLPPRRPRVLAVAIEDAAGALVGVQSSIAQALEAGGWYRPEARPYLPHVTVARVAKHERLRPEAPSPPPPVSLAERTTVTLYRSHLSPSGSRYEAVRVIPVD